MDDRVARDVTEERVRQVRKSWADDRTKDHRKMRGKRGVILRVCGGLFFVAFGIGLILSHGVIDIVLGLLMLSSAFGIIKREL